MPVGRERVDFMTENDQIHCKLLSFLLEYPDTSWSTNFEEIREIIPAVTDEQRRQLLRGFLDYARNTPLIELQEVYTQAFDLDPDTSLHLSYHLIGDSEDRGKVLAGLLWIYHREGFDAAIGELPDYLPMMLEFLSVCPEPEDAALLWSCLGTVAALAERLEEKKHPYAELMRLAANILQPHAAALSDQRSKEV